MMGGWLKWLSTKGGSLTIKTLLIHTFIIMYSKIGLEEILRNTL